MGTIPASENEFPKVIFVEGAAPGTPPAGFVYVYAKADGRMYGKDDTGTEFAMNGATAEAAIAAHTADTSDAHDASAISVLDTGAHFTGTDIEAVLAELFAAIGAGGIPATIIDAAGDLIVGTAADTAARLAIGATNGMSLQRVSGALAWALPPGYEFDYAQITSSVNITATTGATANTVVTGNAVTYDGATAIIVHFFAPEVFLDAQARQIHFVLYDGSTQLGKLGVIFNLNVASGDQRWPVKLEYRLTPSAASHTYSVRAFTNAGTQAVDVGAGGSGALSPGFIRQTKV